MGFISQIPIIGDLWDIGEKVIGGVIANNQQKKAEKRQQGYALEQMAQQASYNKEQSLYEQQLNQQSIDYNANKYNLAWQRDQMLEAGINPALNGSTGFSLTQPSAPQTSVSGVSSSTPIASSPVSDIAGMMSTLADVDLKKKQSDNLDADTDGKLIDNTFKARQNELNLNLTSVDINAKVEGIKFSRQQRKESKARILKLNEDVSVMQEQIQLYRDQHSKNEKELATLSEKLQNDLDLQAQQLANNKLEYNAIKANIGNILAQTGLIKANTANVAEDLSLKRDVHEQKVTQEHLQTSSLRKDVHIKANQNGKLLLDLESQRDYEEWERSLGVAEKAINVVTKVFGNSK